LSSNYSNKIFSNYFLVIISISVVLFLISSFTLIALNSEKIINDFKENIPVVVFIKDQRNKIELSKFEKNIEINKSIKKFVFVSKNDAANKLSEEIGEDFIDYLGYNPLYDSYDIFFTSDNVNNLFIDQLVEEFKNESFVEEVTYDAPLIDLINKNILILKQWSLIIGSIFLFISIILMNNTIRLSVYSNRLNIKTMQLVGASKFFIKKPFIITHIKHGVLSSIISSVLLVSILYYLNLNFFEIDFEKIKESIFITLLFSLGISVIISYFSTSIITGRYISSNIEKLY
jgi:cell division transport system permease protein